MSNVNQPPATDELEISIFGPGYGESILLHVGNGMWITVDSCINPHTKESAPLSYLKSLGIDPAKHIQLVIASHWHADHVRGLYELFSSAKSAKFCCAQALTSTEFSSIAKLYSERDTSVPMGPEELYRCLKLIEERYKSTSQAQVRYAGPDQIIWQTHSSSAIQAKLVSLSPSDRMVERCRQSLYAHCNALAKGLMDPRPLPGSPNDVAVAILLEVNGRRILLGSDLEEEGSSGTGWSAVLDAYSVSTGANSCAYKVAHHGSKTGHHDEVWTKLLSTKPLALLTPFRHGKHALPTKEDRDRILSMTDRAFISADPNGRVKVKRPRSKAQDFIEGAFKDRRLVGDIGHIRWRVSVDDLHSDGEVELFNGAIHLSNIA